MKINDTTPHKVVSCAKYELKKSKKKSFCFPRTELEECSRSVVSGLCNNALILDCPCQSLTCRWSYDQMSAVYLSCFCETLWTCTNNSDAVSWLLVLFHIQTIYVLTLFLLVSLFLQSQPSLGSVTQPVLITVALRGWRGEEEEDKHRIYRRFGGRGGGGGWNWEGAASGVSTEQQPR